MEREDGRQQGAAEETGQHGRQHGGQHVEAAWRWRRGAVAAAAVLSLAAGAVVLGGGANCRGLPGEDAPASIVLAPPEGPGEPLLVRGRVFAPDGETPVPGVVLYVYQTDAEGHYSRSPRRAPRLRGWVRTDAAGRYEVRTIRPGSYPSRREAAHVHVQLWGAGYEPQYSTDLLFADDPLLRDRERERSREAGAFAHVCEPGRAAGGELVCTHNHRLKPEGDDLEQSIRHGLDVPAGEG
jgi:protocatechuate 3,4-dioxygenase beta subunit